MKFIAVLEDENDADGINVGMGNEDITALPVTSVARDGYGIFSIGTSYNDGYPSTEDYRAAAKKLLTLADKIELFRGKKNG